jgi:hypothetical protein
MTPNHIQPPVHPRLGRGNNFVPELAGVCTYEEAAREGLGVEENVAFLKRLSWAGQRANDLLLASLNCTAEWEVKDAFSLHAYLGAEHTRAVQERVAELRHPPHNFHTAPNEKLEAFCQELLRSSGTVEVLVALYRVLLPAMIRAYGWHGAHTNPLADHPTRRALRLARLEDEEAVAWGEAALLALLDSPEKAEAARKWQEHLGKYLSAAGGVSGHEQVLQAPEGEENELPAPRAKSPLRSEEIDWTPRRDSRIESYNFNFPPHWVYAQRERPESERALALVCKRLLEMDVPEMMASIIYKQREAALDAGSPKPWAYTSEMCRQVWDEARHSMLGEAWFSARGIDWTKIPLNVGFSLGLNSLATPQEAHAALYWIEQGLMPSKSGKAYEWRTARDAGDRLAMLFMDYDWADEVLHVHIGHWITEELGSRKAAEEAGERAFARVMAIRRDRQAQEEAEHPQRDWWPGFVRDALGIEAAPLEDSALNEQDAPWKAAATSG